MHSALKQDGKPLYEYARAGMTRERAARAIVIREMRLLDWQPPDLSFDVRCTKGAYIRVLAEDLAAQLGTIGHLAALRRLGVAPFGAEPQWTFEALEAMTPCGARSRCCCPWMRRSRDWRRLDLPADGVECVSAGSVALGPRGMPGKRAHLCGGRGISRSGGDRSPAGSLVPLRLISAATNRA